MPKKGWKEITRFAAGAMAAALTLLTACTGGAPGASPSASGDGDSSGAQGAMGRYVETQIALPEGTQGIQQMLVNAQGALDVYLYDKDGNLTLYTLEDGALAPQTIPWMESLNTQWGLDQIAYDSSGGVALLLMDYAQYAETGRMEPHLVKVGASGESEEIPIEWPEERDYISGFSVLADGSVLVIQQPQGVLHFNADGTLRATLDGFAQAAGGHGDEVAVVRPGTIDFYAAQTGDQLEPIEYAYSDSQGVPLWYDAGGTLYIALDKGVYSRAPGASELTQVLDGQMYSIASPALRLEGFVKAQDVFYIYYYDTQNQPQIRAFTFQQDVPARPEKTLSVVSLSKHDIVRQAATMMGEKYPDVYVDLRILLERQQEGDVTSIRDALKSVNTELLAGKGADVYILDDMPIESYIEKGVLMDLSAWSAPHMESGEWMGSIVSSYQEDGKTYAIPTLFGLPMMSGSDEFVSAVKTFSDLAAYAQSHTELPLFYAMHPQNLMEYFYPVTAPYWMDETGGIKQGEFIEFLDTIKKLADTAPDVEYKMKGNGMDGSSEIPAKYSGLSQVIVQEVKDADILPLDVAALEAQGGGSFAPLAGQAANTFVPYIIAGINAKTAQEQQAKDFLEILLSEQAQSVRYSNYEGLPVNAAALRKAVVKTAEEAEKYRFSAGFSLEEAENGFVGIYIDSWIPQAEQERFLQYCEQAKTPTKPDRVLMSMILEETAGFFDGSLTAEQAAAAVAQRTQAYLSE